eukprot:3877747-Pleurochrysis_carterae.AAC.1
MLGGLLWPAESFLGMLSAHVLTSLVRLNVYVTSLRAAGQIIYFAHSCTWQALPIARTTEFRLVIIRGFAAGYRHRGI